MIPWPSLFATRRMAAVGAELPVLRAKEGDAPVKPYRNRPKTPRLGEMCPRRGGRASGVASATSLGKAKAITYRSKRPTSGSVTRYSGYQCVSAGFSEGLRG